MADLDVGIVTWSGFIGAPGMTVMHATPGNAGMAKIRDLFDGVKGLFPPDVTWSFPSSGDTIDDTTGELTGSWSGATLANLSGTGAGNYSAPSGVRVRWVTSDIVNGRRVRGMTFFVPTLASFYDSAGQVSTIAVADFQTPVNAFVTAMNGALKIWSRPTATRPGSSHVVTQGIVSSQVAVLRKRRD